MNVYTSSLPKPFSPCDSSIDDRFSIRKARTEDLGGVAEVLTHSFHSCEGWGMLMYPFLKVGIYEDIRSRMCSHRSYYACLIATTSRTQTVAGAVELSLSSPEGWIPQQYQTTYISNLAVSPHYRRQGIAKQLLQRCEQLTSSWGFQEVYLHVLDNNEKAQQLYKSCGYCLCRTEPSLLSWLFNQPKRLLLKKVVTPE